MDTKQSSLSRRRFFKKSTFAAASALPALSVMNHSLGAHFDKIRVGLVGCGGRGTGAARDVLLAGPNIELVAMGDIFEAQIEQSLNRLRRFTTDKRTPLEGIRVARSRRFAGLDAYKKVIDSGIDYVLLCTPPGFRPLHIAYAVEKGVTIFAEKPCATDPPGVRRILDLVPAMKKKGIAFLSGFNGRHVFNSIDAVKRIQDGAIGKVTSLYAYFNTGNIWYRDPRPGMAKPEYWFYNWFHVDWLCGDHIVEQHIHNLDHCNWVMQRHPIKAYGMGGRQYHTDRGGNIYDHFAVEFDYPGGARLTSVCRQIQPTEKRIGEVIFGTEGKAFFLHGGKPEITGKHPHVYRQDPPDQHESHRQEHIDFVAALRKGETINEAQLLCESTLTAIMGREAAYTGKTVTWDEILASNLTLTPDDIGAWDGTIRAVPKPGDPRL